jgi:hypothetical protein
MSHFSRIDVVTQTPGDARKGSAYRKCLSVEVNFLKVFIEVNGMCENGLFFDISKGPKMDPVCIHS